MRGAKILITGPTGQVASPIAAALAADNEVWGIARFTNAAARQALEDAGVRCKTVNLAAGEFDGLPTDFDYVLNLAVAKSGDWDKDLGANAESVGLLISRGLRPTGRRATHRALRVRGQPQTLVSHLLHLQDRR